MTNDLNNEPGECLPHEEIGHGLTLDQLVENLLETRDRIAQLRDHERFLIEEIYDAAPGRKTETAFGLVEVSKRRNRRWDHDEVTKHVVSRALDERLVNADTGEVEPSWVAVTRAIRECAGIGYWRVGALKDRGLDPDEFAETTSEAKSVQIR
ncbi:MAG: hypothetical protein ACPHFO_08010 [Acidimicrobiales bacterium]